MGVEGVYRWDDPVSVDTCYNGQISPVRMHFDVSFSTVITLFLIVCSSLAPSRIYYDFCYLNLFCVAGSVTQITSIPNYWNVWLISLSSVTSDRSASSQFFTLYMAPWVFGSPYSCLSLFFSSVVLGENRKKKYTFRKAGLVFDLLR
jgi:hypothetical protein